MEGKEIDEVANFTRKDKAERFLNKLFRGLKKADRHYPYWVRQGYFKSYKQIGRIEHKMNRMKTKLDRQFKKRQIWRIEETSRERRRVQAQRSSWLAYR